MVTEESAWPSGAMPDFEADACRACASRLRALHILRLSPSGIVEACNAAAAHHLGVPASALVGQPVSQRLTVLDGERLMAELGVQGRREAPLLLNFCDVYHMPYTLMCYLDVDAHGATLVAEPPLGCDRRDQRLLLDVTQELALLSRERVRAEYALRVSQQALLERERALENRSAELAARNAQLRRLASELVLAEQRAREVVAKTLHDDLQQLIFGAMLKLDRLENRMTGSLRERDLIVRARADLEESVRAARSLSVDLFSPVLHDGGLPSAVSWLGPRIQDQYGVIVGVSADPRANPEGRDVRTLLFESVRELLFNAVKHAHVDRVDVELTLTPDDAVCITVRDEGVGFDPVVSLDSVRLGLGLFSIRERLTLLRGHLEVDSAPGNGARISLRAPRRDRSVEQATTEARVDGTGPGAHLERTRDGSAGPLRILIVDDHVIVRAGLRELFAEHPSLLAVGEAASGPEAIAQAELLQPDVIVMDVSMPGMDGVEATRRIHAAYPHIHIVGLSTHDHEGAIRRMGEAGAVAYFAKGEGAERLLGFLLAEHAARSHTESGPPP